jgi:hypothetical protein
LRQKKYFLLHAPRQTGKTTCLLALADYLNQARRLSRRLRQHRGAQALRENVEQGDGHGRHQHRAGRARRWATKTPCPGAEVLATNSAGGCAGRLSLTRWCQQLDKPLVLMLDEVDALVGDTLISLLRQLRAGYPKRPAQFPQSLILCGVRDLQDYRIQAEREGIITGGSAFNIKAKSLRLGDFDQPETETLLLEHTAETGQVFTPEALERIWELTNGQPWLVNALAYETTWEMKAGRDRSRGPSRGHDPAGQGGADPAPRHAPRPTGGQAARAARAPRDRGDPAWRGDRNRRDPGRHHLCARPGAGGADRRPTCRSPTRSTAR